MQTHVALTAGLVENEGHGVHTVLPAAEYVFTVHGVHESPAPVPVCRYPAEQVHVEAAAADVLPLGQAVQDVNPVLTAYVFAAHVVQANMDKVLLETE